MKPCCAFITGITGQDGSYLTEYLLDLGYTVHGMIRRASTFNTKRIDHVFDRINLHYGDITDMNSIIAILARIKDSTTDMIEIYNLAAQSHVKVSFENPVYTAHTDAIGTLNLLESIRILNIIDRVKLYQASTSELYGKVVESPQNELTPFNPQSPYAIAKLYSYWIMKNYRDAYKMFACNGILFNHTSPRRGETFVGRKITRAVKSIQDGTQSCLYLGNLNSKRDWGHAKDYVHGMHLILQYDTPGDWVLATGEMHTVREFVEIAFGEIGITLSWRGNGVDEVGYCGDKIYVRVDPKYFRPTEVEELLGDATLAKNILGWSPEYTFKEIIKEMVESEE